MYQRLKRRLRRSRLAIILYHILTDLLAGLRLRLGRRRTHSGATHQGLSIEESLRYVDAVYDDYLQYALMSEADLEERDVLEVGPGDNLGVALRFLADGARRVVCLDRFASIRDAHQEREIYRALRAGLADESRARLDAAVDVERFGTDGSRLRVIRDRGIERACEVLEPSSLDVIVSRASLEHVADPSSALRAMDVLLRPGGVQIHKIDLRDHGMFTNGGFAALEFLTVAEPLYRRMTRHSGRPNRQRVGAFRAAWIDAGYDVEIFVTHVAGEVEERIPHVPWSEFEVPAEARAAMGPVRSRLTRPHRDLPEFELCILGIFVVARKP